MNNKRSIIFSIIAISLVLLMVIGATFAYFQAQINDGASSEVAIDTDTVDILTFNASNDIMLEATQDNFSREKGNISGSTTLNAHLIANSTTKSATYKYNVYLDITKNNFVYSTENSTPEIVLVIKNPKEEYITKTNSKIGNTTKVDLKGEQVTGYDITTKAGLLEISLDYQIDTYPYTNGEADQNWQISVVLVNLDSNQVANAGKSFKAKAKVQSEKINVLDLSGVSYYYKTSTYKNKIKNVYFVDYIASEEELNSVATNANWDLSSVKDKSIMGWLKEENEDTTAPYNLYIGSNLKEGEKIVVRSFKYAFHNMQNLETVDLNLDILDTSNLNDTSEMFFGTSKLTTITGIEELDVSNVINMAAMFSGASSLTTLDLSNWNTSNVTRMSSMFYNASSLTEIDLSKWNTSNVTNMSSMFNRASSLTEIDLSTWNTSNVTDMSYMFSNASSLTELDLSTWNTSNVTDMSNMFSYTYKLKTLNLSKIDTHNVTTMSMMFYSASSLTELDLSKWNTSNVINMGSMFSGASNLTTIGDLSNWDTGNVTDMSGMFSSANSSMIPDISKWDTSKVENMSYLFSQTSYNYDISKIDTHNVTNMSFMFRYYRGSTITGIENLNTSNVTNMSSMFFGVNSLTELDLSGWDTSRVIDMYSMFNQARNLTSIDMRKATFNQETNYINMFSSTNPELKVTITGDDNKQRLLDNTDLTEDQLIVLPE